MSTYLVAVTHDGARNYIKQHIRNDERKAPPSMLCNACKGLALKHTCELICTTPNLRISDANAPQSTQSQVRTGLACNHQSQERASKYAIESEDRVDNYWMVLSSIPFVRRVVVVVFCSLTVPYPIGAFHGPMLSPYVARRPGCKSWHNTRGCGLRYTSRCARASQVCRLRSGLRGA